MSVTTYSILNPPNPALRTDCPRGGILLNATRPTSQSPIQSPIQRPYLPSSPSSSSSSGSDESVNHRLSPGRRITFAPLPNPRAQEATDTQLPVIILDPVNDSLANEHSDSALSLSGDDCNLVQGSAGSSPVLAAKKSSSWGHSTKKFFRPFYKPLQKAATLDVDGGTLGLFRASSRESNSSTGTLTDSGAPLARRMSTGSTPYHLGPTNHVVPDKRTSLTLTPVFSENGGVAAGTRMLNGRVYGRSRVRTTERDDREPEFVEWGYGGMGSNRGSSASSRYAKLQGNNAIVEDEDDGSGMGWVKKRREAREREKREREEQEAKEKAAREESDHLPAASNTPIEEGSIPTAKLTSSATASTPSTPSEHITQTVAIPRRPQASHHHSSRPTHSRRSSDSHLSAAGTITPVHVGSGPTPPMISRMSTDSTRTITAAVTSGPSSLRKAVEVESSSDEDEDEEDDTEETTEREDDKDDEEDEEADERKTSLCAGVEKISRHKE